MFKAYKSEAGMEPASLQRELLFGSDDVDAVVGHQHEVLEGDALRD